MIPKKFEPVVFGLVLSGLMSLVVSGISILRTSGLSADFIRLWTGAWLTAWLFAFPVVLLVAPVARRAVQHLLVQECEGDCWRG